MGLFGGKKDKNTVKITDYYSAEELQQIRETVKPKLAANAYLAMGELLAKGLIAYVERPEKEYSYHKMNSFMKIADAMKDFEPSLEPILQNGINKYRSGGQ